jgi:hypothetical protein
MVEERNWNPAGLLVLVGGGTLGVIVALVLFRRWRRGSGSGLRDIPWRDVITLMGPIIALARGLLEIRRRQADELELQ